MPKYDGVRCPKCKKILKRSGKHVKCSCGWSHSDEESAWTKRLEKIMYARLF